MIALRIGLLIAYGAACLGCASNGDKTADFCANYERPSFVVSFLPESIREKEPIVDIAEDSSGATIRVDWAREQYRIADMSRYLRLKKQMLISRQWRKRVPESDLLGAFTGAPRDILIARSGNEGVCLQGSDVPRGWREELIRLARTGKGMKIGEQSGSSNGG